LGAHRPSLRRSPRSPDRRPSFFAARRATGRSSDGSGAAAPHHWLANFTTVFFRRSMPQITNPGGMILRKQLLKGLSRDRREKILEKHGFDAPLLWHD
jgi:hypothetical protein